MNNKPRNIYWTAAITIWIGCYCNAAVAEFVPAVDDSTALKVTLYAPTATPVEVVSAQLEALNFEDLNAATDAIHPSSPDFSQTKDWTEKLFKIYDIRYTLEKNTLESETENTAKVGFSQLTEKISGPAFRNNRIDGVHILKKYDGNWKIYETQIVKIEFLDELNSNSAN
jgi:hypothetical protein